MGRFRDLRSATVVPSSAAGVVQVLVRANARSPRQAQSLEALGLRASPTFTGLVQRGLVSSLGGAESSRRYYLDAERYRRRSRQRVARQLGTLLGVLVLASLLLVGLLYGAG